MKHGGASRIRTRPGTPHRDASRALRQAERAGLLPPGLAGSCPWRRAMLRQSANMGARLAMLAAWGARDVEAWAQAVRAIV
jgi:hypothetical protein